MRVSPNQDLQALLLDAEASSRMLALELLSEGYAQGESILAAVFTAWDRWGAEHAFPGFPTLSYLPVAESQIADCCQRAAAMAAGRKLTDPSSRCAGKLLEQVMSLPASQLHPHLPAIVESTAVSKIFFRVDVAALQRRIALQALTADQLAQRLESALESLSRQSANAAAFHDALHALEALRMQHPDYLDMSAAVARCPELGSVGAASFQVSLQSLIQFPQAGAEATLARHLADDREAVHMGAVEALVRIGSPLAAAHLIDQFASAAGPAQRWIARGLQRIRAPGLAEELARLRPEVADPALWLMLLVAEVRQFDVDSLPQITAELPRIGSYAGALIDAMHVYVRLHSTAPDARSLQQVFMDYLQQANVALQSQIAARR